MIYKLNKAVVKLTSYCAVLFMLVFMAGFSLNSYAQDINEIRWQSEQHVRSLYGEPNAIVGPTGTHASYTLWKYNDFTVAFANQRAFHIFDKDSLHKIELEENR